MHNGRVARQVLVLAIALAATPAPANGSGVPSVEIAVWSRNYHGTVGGKPVQLHALRREATHVAGRYCYGECRREQAPLMLEGTLDDESLTLQETENTPSGTTRATGNWRLHMTATGAHGEWHSADGRRTLPVELQIDAEPGSPFPYEIRLVANALPDYGDDSCDNVPLVSAIRLYRGCRLVQELETESQGTCGLFIPAIIDMDFDGSPDLTLATTLPAGPNIPHDSWLFDAKHQRFVKAPQSLQDITSADFDPVHRVVHNFWRSGAASHGIDTYRWRNGELEQIDSQQSHFMPVRKDGKLGYYYVMPTYRDGHITFDPLLQRGRDGRLSLQSSADAPEFHEEAGTWSVADALHVWRVSGTDQAPQRVESHPLQWKTLSTPQGPRWCAEITYFDVDTRRIGRQVMTGETGCQDSDPNQ